MRSLKLQIVDYQDEAHWKWRLLDKNDAFCADHTVALDKASNEYRGFLALPQYLQWHEAPRSRDTHERSLIAGMAGWIRTETFGPIADAILTAAEVEPVAILVQVPPQAEALLYRPFELAFVADPDPRAADVSLVFQIGLDQSPRIEKNPVGGRLRFLAVFSTPTDHAALNVRYERLELRQLIDRLAQGASQAVELRIVQYGVTRALLEDILDEGDGWDIVHFSGHGLPAGIVLEKPDGAAHLIQSSEFATLLWPGRGQLKMVTLSSCESGATMAAQALQSLGVEPPDEMALTEVSQVATPSPLPAIAQQLSSQLGCAVLAMRFPVEDRFAIDLSSRLYENLLGNDQALPRALQRALHKAVPDRGRDAGLSLATPALFGAGALDLRLKAPPAGREGFQPTSGKLAYFEPEPARFVGRVRQLAKASAALAPRSDYRAVLFHGMAGAGKTACALELAYRHEERRFSAMAWHRAPSEGQSIDAALANFANSLSLQIDDFEFAHVVDDATKLRNFLPRLREQMAKRALLIVLDNVESLLGEDGDWRDARWEHVIGALSDHGGLSRLVLTTRVVPNSLHHSEHVLIQSIDSLSAGESALLARQMPNLGKLLGTDSEIGQPAGQDLVRRALEIVQGNPKLIEFADRQATEASVLEARISEADKTWSTRADLSVFFKTGDPDSGIGADDFLRVIENWSHSIASTLSGEQRLAFQVLCCLEPGDRRLPVLAVAQEAIWESVEADAKPPDPVLVTEALAEAGLIDFDEDPDQECRIHSAVEQAELKLVDGHTRKAVDTAMAGIWASLERRAREAGDTRAETHSSFAAAPYLLRIGEAGFAIAYLSRVVTRDSAPSNIATVMPLAQQGLELASNPEDRRRAQFLLLRCAAALRSTEVIPQLEVLIALAEEEGDTEGVAVMRGDLFNLLIRKGRLEEAKEEVEKTIALDTKNGSSDWARAGHEGQRLQVLQLLGENDEVLAGVQLLLDQIDRLEASNPKDLIAIPLWNLRESILSTGRAAAKGTESWDQVLHFVDEIGKSQNARGAPDIDKARTVMNSLSALFELDRLEDAENALRAVRRSAEAAKDPHLLGTVFETWATFESRRGNLEEALVFNRAALRSVYQFAEPRGINVSHHNVASHLMEAGGDPEEIMAHRLAEVLISYQTNSGEYGGDLEHLVSALSYTKGQGIPNSFDELRARLQAVAGVDFASLFALLPNRSPDGESALRAVLDDAQQLRDGLPDDSS